MNDKFNRGPDYDDGRRDMSDRDRDDEDYRRDPDRVRAARHAGRGPYRGVYEEQVWSRDPRSGQVYGNEYGMRPEPRRFNQGDETHDSWRNRASSPRESQWGPNNPDWRANEINRTPENYRNWYPAGLPHQPLPGQHYGKGPKDYVRSDARLREDVCDRLSDDDEIDASDMTVTVKDREVTLDGNVIDRHTKRRAEDVAALVSGVRDVHNRLSTKKGIIKELSDKMKGTDEADHHGHRGEGPTAAKPSSQGNHGSPPVR